MYCIVQGRHISAEVNCIVCTAKLLKMSAYKSMKVVDLCALCDERGVSHAGLKKDDIIAALEYYDQAADVDDLDNDHVSSEGSASEGEDVDSAEPGAVESSEIRALQLRLQLAREQRKMMESRERLQAAGGAGIGRGRNEGFVFEKPILPRMTESTDLLAWFNTFERALLLSDVPRSQWGRLLPGCMSEKAAKIYSKLSVDKCRDYDFVKAG